MNKYKTFDLSPLVIGFLLIIILALSSCAAVPRSSGYGCPSTQKASGYHPRY